MKTGTRSEHGHSLHVSDFKKMILGANYFFDREKEAINALNVFPVPDGDTGTNMSMTLKAAIEGSLAYKGNSIGELSEIVASRALMGARGNSGVILSQILRGLARGLRNKEYISPGELSKAFQYGVVYAYKAVSKPVEGTILTVAREMARGIRLAVRKGENLYGSMEAAIDSGRETLAKTTDMLPALKEAGVVDAGGLGLLVFLEGCLYAMKRSLHEMLPHNWVKHSEEFTAAETAASSTAGEKFDLDNPYCTEMIIEAENRTFDNLRLRLENHGDSLVVAIDGNVAKIHIHTASPDLIIKTALTYGSLHDIKIDNMLDQHSEPRIVTTPAENNVLYSRVTRSDTGKSGLISVSFGEGFREIFLSLGADEIVYGGQTMNPNVEVLLNAVQNLPQETAIILPNNKNIIMVAEQVKVLSEKNVEVLETRSLPEGLSALLAYNPNQGVAENIIAMNEAIGRVQTGMVTYATRDSVIRGNDVKQGQYLALTGDEILSSGESLHQTAIDLVKTITTPNNDLITVFYGQDVKQNQATALVSAIEELFPELEIELHYGGQPIYYYILSVE